MTKPKSAREEFEARRDKLAFGNAMLKKKPSIHDQHWIGSTHFKLSKRSYRSGYDDGSSDPLVTELVRAARELGTVRPTETTKLKLAFYKVDDAIRNYEQAKGDE